MDDRKDNDGLLDAWEYGGGREDLRQGGGLVLILAGTVFYCTVTFQNFTSVYD
jgi:hypothetical protein